MNKDELLRLHSFSSMNRDALSVEQTCGCFYCRRIFSSSEIKDFVDNGRTALCPFCGIDAVIGESCGFEITDKLLRSMHLAFFESGTGNTVSTPFGNVILLKDGKRRSFRFEALEPTAPYASVDGIYRLCYSYNGNGQKHTFELMLDNSECNGGEDSGEGMTALTADISGGRITLSVINKGNELAVDVKNDRLTVTIPASAASQNLTFGVCYMKKLTSPDSVETWLGADVG